MNPEGIRPNGSISNPRFFNRGIFSSNIERCLAPVAPRGFQHGWAGMVAWRCRIICSKSTRSCARAGQLNTSIWSLSHQVGGANLPHQRSKGKLPDGKSVLQRFDIALHNSNNHLCGLETSSGSCTICQAGSTPISFLRLLVNQFHWMGCNSGTEKCH